MRSAFTGAFAPYICGLIEKKQALGYDYHGSACILRTFDEFCREQFPNETCLTAELAMKWAEQFKTEKNLSRLNRVSVIRELAKYMNSVGEQAYDTNHFTQIKRNTVSLRQGRIMSICWIEEGFNMTPPEPPTLSED